MCNLSHYADSAILANFFDVFPIGTMGMRSKNGGVSIESSISLPRCSMSWSENLAAIYRSRLILKNFLLQDIKVKYRRSILGFGWALLHPMLMLLVLTAAFSFIFHRSAYTLHLFATLLPWVCMSNAVEGAARSLVSSQALLRQYNIPKLVFPIRNILFSFCEYIFSLAGLFGIAFFVGFQPSPALVVLPLSIVLLFLFAVGIGSLAAVSTVYFRDMGHLIGVALRAWFYLTPIIIPFEQIPTRYQPLARLNPMYYLTEMFDAPITHGVFPALDIVAFSAIIAAAICLIGMLLFFRVQDELIFRL